MKVYITNHSDKKIHTNKEQSIFVHYFDDCKKLNACYSENGIILRNSGTQEIDLDNKEKLFSTLVSLKKFKICNECEQRDFALSYENDINNVTNQTSKEIYTGKEESEVLTEAKHTVLSKILGMKFSEYQAKLASKFLRT